MARPDPWDTSQPHYITSRENEYGDTRYYCRCGKTQTFRSLIDYSGGRTVRPLHRHIEENFDGRCHFKRYGMECGRFYGHRGLHRELAPKPSFSRLRELLLAANRQTR